MSAPRHLWAGDWRDESSAHAQALAARAPREAPAEPAPAIAAPRRAVSRRTSLRHFLARVRAMRLGRERRLRAAGLVVSLALVSAGAAYVVTSLVVRAMGGA
jgi:hypothetical protein